MTNCIFLSRVQRFNCFSRAIALLTSLKGFPIYKPIKFVFAGKTFKGACLVLKNAVPKVISDADIKPFRTIHHDVDVKTIFLQA